MHCRDCNEADPSWHAICENKKIEGKHGPGTFNFKMKCKFCSNVGTVGKILFGRKCVTNEKWNSIGKIKINNVISFLVPVLLYCKQTFFLYRCCKRFHKTTKDQR